MMKDLGYDTCMADSSYGTTTSSIFWKKNKFRFVEKFEVSFEPDKTHSAIFCRLDHVVQNQKVF